MLVALKSVLIILLKHIGHLEVKQDGCQAHPGSRHRRCRRCPVQRLQQPASQEHHGNSYQYLAAPDFLLIFSGPK